MTEDPTQAELEINRFEQLDEALTLDMLEALVALRDRNSPYDRRTVVRTLFAHIDGSLFAMKCIALGRERDTPGLFTLGELTMLREEAYELDQKGAVKTRPSNLRFLTNLRFTFAAFAKAYMVSYEPDYGHNGWECLQKALVIRNRLMHPKAAADLVLADGDLELVKDASNWFSSSRRLAVRAAGKG